MGRRGPAFGELPKGFDISGYDPEERGPGGPGPGPGPGETISNFLEPVELSAKAAAPSHTGSYACAYSRCGGPSSPEGSFAECLKVEAFYINVLPDLN